MNNWINTFFSIYTTIKFHGVKTYFFIIFQHTCFCIYQTLKNIYFFFYMTLSVCSKRPYRYVQHIVTVNTCRNSVDISQWLTGTSCVHAEENLKKPQKINTVTCTLSIWKQIFKEKINILKNFHLNMFIFEHIRTLDTDRKSIPEQINVLQFF